MAKNTIASIDFSFFIVNLQEFETTPNAALRVDWSTE